MTAQETKQVNLRIPVGIIEDIDKSVKKERYRNRQEFILAAVRVFLEEREMAPRPVRTGGTPA